MVQRTHSQRGPDAHALISHRISTRLITRFVSFYSYNKGDEYGGRTRSLKSNSVPLHFCLDPLLLFSCQGIAMKKPHRLVLITWNKLMTGKG
jgi:hypothetical protein